jgi:hypothetical protein
VNVGFGKRQFLEVSCSQTTGSSLADSLRQIGGDGLDTQRPHWLGEKLVHVRINTPVVLSRAMCLAAAQSLSLVGYTRLGNLLAWTMNWVSEIENERNAEQLADSLPSVSDHLVEAMAGTEDERPEIGRRAGFGVPQSRPNREQRRHDGLDDKAELHRSACPVGNVLRDPHP